MSLDRSDRCPHCGAPYMSTLAPGEVDNRVCYTCNSVAATPDMNTPVDDDLSIQPLEGGTSGYHAAKGNVRKQMERQIRSSGVRAGVTSKANLPAVRKSVSNAAMPAARISNAAMPAARAGSNPSMPAAKPAGPSTQSMPAVRNGGSTRINIQPAQQADTAEDGSQIELEAEAETVAAIPAPRMSSARMQAARSSARHRAVPQEKRGGSPLVFAAVGGMLLVAGAAIYFAMSSGSKSTDAVAANTPTTNLPPPVTKTVAPVVAAPKVETTPAKTQPAAPAPVKVEPAAPAVPETPAVAQPETPAVPESKPAPEKTDINATLFTTKRAANAKLDDEEAMVEAGPGKTTKKNAAPGKDEVAAADPKKPVDALGGMGITGTKKTKPEDAVPEFDDIRKAKPVIPVTSTEPTIIKEDLTLGDQNPEKVFSQSIQTQFPGWRVRDVMLDQSQSMFTSADHRGKKDVLILNPLNDTLPAKLYCTVEIPKEYSGKRPMLAFEVSTKDKNADWFLAVKCQNVDMRSKSAVRCPDEAKWQPVVVDLSALAGKRFELAIESYMTPKTNKKLWKDERAYIRNVQLMWTGKK